MWRYLKCKKFILVISIDSVVIISVKYGKKLVVENKIEIVQRSQSFREIFNNIYTKYTLEKCVNVSLNNTDWFDIDFDHVFSTALRCNDSVVSAEPPSSSRLFTDVLMRTERIALTPMVALNNINKLHNKVLYDIQSDGDGKRLITGFSQNDGIDGCLMVLRR